MASQKLFIDIVARDKATKALQGLQGGLAKVRSAVFNVKNAFLGLGAGLVVRNLVSTGKEIENLRTRLKFLLKDTTEGAKAFENMAEFASRVPFSLEEISRGSGILATITDNADDLQKMLQITGNVAAVTGLDFRTTAEQIQRSFSAGIGAADLFREKGVRNMLGFKAGAAVSIEETAKAFERVFGVGGRFGKATDELAKTLEGTLSMIGDKAFNFKRVLLDAGFFSELKRQFGDLDKFLVDNAESIERIAIGFGTTLAQAVKGVANFFVFLKDNIDAVITGFKVLIAIKIVAFFISLGKAIVPVLAGLRGLAGLSLVGLTAVAASVAATAATFKIMNKEIDEMLESLDQAIDKNISMRNTNRENAILMREFKKEVEEILVPIHEFEHELSVAVPSATQKAIDKFEELNESALENLKNKVNDIRMTIAEGLNAGIGKFSNALARAIVLGEDLGKSFKRMVQDALVQTLSVLIEILIRMAIQKLFGIELEKQENRQLNVMKKKTSELKKQVALQALLLMMGGGGGGGLPFFNKGGSVRKGQPVIVGDSASGRGGELFIPNSSGQIVPNSRLGSMGGGVNVNFNINTVDASGFEELLVNSRGTISQLINQALNEKGQGNLI
jgi:hypothetical protein